MNRLINFLIRWKLKRGMWVINLPYYAIDYYVCEYKTVGILKIMVRRKE